MIWLLTSLLYVEYMNLNVEEFNFNSSDVPFSFYIIPPLLYRLFCFWVQTHTALRVNDGLILEMVFFFFTIFCFFVFFFY